MLKKYQKLTEAQLSGIKKILIIQHKPFGDILLNTGYLPELRRNFPDAQIDYLIQRPYITVMEDNPHIDNLVIMETNKHKGIRYYVAQIGAAIKVRKGRYDLIIDQLRGTSSARMVAFSRATYRLGYIKKGWNFLYNVQIPQAKTRYRSLYKFDLLAPLGISVKEHNLEYKIRGASFDYIKNWILDTGLGNEEIVVISPSSPVKQKRWHPDCFAELGDKIHRNTRFKIVLSWAPNEKRLVDYIRTKMETDVVISPMTTFNQVGALLNFAKVLICNDSGINHLAVSQRTPSVAIFGPKSNPLKWCAWHKKEYVYLKDWDFKDRQDNTFNITPDQVFEKFQELLEIVEKI
jgi:ADP-heptose:LPS heptosyltransferase